MPKKENEFTKLDNDGNEHERKPSVKRVSFGVNDFLQVMERRRFHSDSAIIEGSTIFDESSTIFDEGFTRFDDSSTKFYESSTKFDNSLTKFDETSRFDELDGRRLSDNVFVDQNRQQSQSSKVQISHGFEFHPDQEKNSFVRIPTGIR
jgi:hypothetical protein